jgi:hypothetical protein
MEISYVEFTIAIVIAIVTGVAAPISFLIVKFFYHDWIQTRSDVLSKELAILQKIKKDSDEIEKIKAEKEAKKKAKELATNKKFVANKHKVAPLKGKALKQSDAKNRELYTEKK